LIVLAVQETFGLREFGSLMGVFQMATIISIGGGPWLAGAVHDRYGSFDAAFAIIVGIFILGAVALLAARQPQWNRPAEATEHAASPEPGHGAAD
jgi:cyanate permease